MSKFIEPFVPEGSPLLYRSWADYPVHNFSYTLASDVDDCGQKTIYSRFQGFTNKIESASFKFGICCEDAVRDHLKFGSGIEENFVVAWEKYKNVPLEYTKNDSSWFGLNEKGKALMRQFYRRLSFTDDPLTIALKNVEFGIVFPRDQYQTWYNGTRLDYIADFVGNPDDGPIILDMKTAGQTYIAKEGQEGYAALDPQLQTGSLVSGIRRVGFIVLVKTKSPSVEFLQGVVTDKMLESRDAWLREQYHKLIDRRLFMRSSVRWPNDHCKNCDFLPKCLGNEKLASETLRQKESKAVKTAFEMLDD